MNRSTLKEIALCNKELENIENAIELLKSAMNISVRFNGRGYINIYSTPDMREKMIEVYEQELKRVLADVEKIMEEK